jgi:hypothetical protein
MEKLPLFKLTIKEDEEAIQEVNAVALVDIPAIGQPFFAFNKQLFVEPGEAESQDEFIPRCIEYMINEGKDNEQAAAICYSMWENRNMNDEEKFAFSVINEDERVVIGPAMIPDLPIYRKDETGEYYVFFDKKTIETIALKFYAKGFQQNANEMHSKFVDGITFFQSWIADESKGIPKMKQFENLPDGTWFLGAKIENDETWAKVKDGTFKGFSVEGMFDMTEIKMRQSADVIIAKLRELLADI